MDQKIARSLVRALRSGKYVQAEGQLRDPNHVMPEGGRGDGFCCLGVLCNLHAKAHPEIAKYEDDPAKYMGEEATLPEHVRLWAGMRSDDGDFEDAKDEGLVKGLSGTAKGATTLVELNDSHYNFEEIANFISKNYRLL